mgnify:CR=1 FL=1
MGASCAAHPRDAWRCCGVPRYASATSPCYQETTLQPGLAFEWTLLDGGALPFVPTPSPDSRELIIPANTLNVSQSYAFLVTVTSPANSGVVLPGTGTVSIGTITAVRWPHMSVVCVFVCLCVGFSFSVPLAHTDACMLWDDLWRSRFHRHQSLRSSKATAMWWSPQLHHSSWTGPAPSTPTTCHNRLPRPTHGAAPKQPRHPWRVAWVTSPDQWLRSLQEAWRRPCETRGHGSDVLAEVICDAHVCACFCPHGGVVVCGVVWCGVVSPLLHPASQVLVHPVRQHLGGNGRSPATGGGGSPRQ